MITTREVSIHFAEEQLLDAICSTVAIGTRAIDRDQSPQMPLPNAASSLLAHAGLNGYQCSQPDVVDGLCSMLAGGGTPTGPVGGYCMSSPAEGP